MGMDVQELRWFQQVADGVTLTEISDLEQVSQPGVSRALARLEREVGAPLLRRSGRVLRLTHAGVVFKRHVDRVVHSLDDGLAAVQQLIDPETGLVTVVFDRHLGTWLVPDLVGTFGRLHPEVRFDLHTKSDESVLEIGPGSDVDLELTTLRMSAAEVDRSQLTDEPLRLIVPPDHRLAGAPATSLAEVADDPFIMIRPTSLLRKACEDLCRGAGFVPNATLVADDVPTMRGYVAAGLGVAVVPALRETTAEPLVGRLHHLDLTDPAASRVIDLAWSTARRMLPSAELFRDFVLERARADALPRPLSPG